MLPQTLSDLSDPISGYVVPTDPETGRSYEFSTRGLMGTRTTPSGLSFELCADFSTQSDSSGNNGYMGARNLPVTLENQSWAHTKGHVCFSRMIDPALYPPVSK